MHTPASSSSGRVPRMGRPPLPAVVPVVPALLAPAPAPAPVLPASPPAPAVAPPAPPSPVGPASIVCVPADPACAVALLPAVWPLVTLVDMPPSAEDVPASNFETPPFVEDGSAIFVGVVPDELASIWALSMGGLLEHAPMTRRSTGLSLSARQFVGYSCLVFDIYTPVNRVRVCAPFHTCSAASRHGANRNRIDRRELSGVGDQAGLATGCTGCSKSISAPEGADGVGSGADELGAFYPGFEGC